jgi:hypothetical protein
MKIPRLGVAKDFANKIHWVLDLAIGIQLPLSATIAILTTLLIADM